MTLLHDYDRAEIWLNEQFMYPRYGNIVGSTLYGLANKTSNYWSTYYWAMLGDQFKDLA